METTYAPRHWPFCLIMIFYDNHKTPWRHIHVSVIGKTVLRLIITQLSLIILEVSLVSYRKKEILV